MAFAYFQNRPPTQNPSRLPSAINRHAEAEALCRRFVTLNHTAVLGGLNTVGCDQPTLEMVRCYVFDPNALSVIQHIRCYPAIQACELEFESTTPCAL